MEIFKYLTFMPDFFSKGYLLESNDTFYRCRSADLVDLSVSLFIVMV